MNNAEKRILIAAAWPYANGSLHLGHAAGLLGADVIARHGRLAGNDVLFVSGSDCHGTPIVVEAEKQRVLPREIAEKYHREFQRDLIGGLKFSYDIYTTTMTENHRRTVQEIFIKLYDGDLIYKKTEQLPYCPSCGRFLPDRYLEGICPICGFAGARGDQCDECGNLLVPEQLRQPRCKICGAAPELRPSENFYLRLSVFASQLRQWVEDSVGWRVNAKRFSLNLIAQGPPDRAVTRDIDWGVPIPLRGYGGKSIYVWFEAVCGYLSASKEWARSRGEPELWKKFWQAPTAMHYYVHGKDNIPFHTVVWPAILLGVGGLHLPDRIISSEHLTLEKRQFSKSRNWVVLLKDFLRESDPDALRYYLIVNGPETADADFSRENYRLRTNSELIGTFGNYVHRVLSFVKTHFPAGVELAVAPRGEGAELLKRAEAAFAKVGEAIEEGRFRDGLSCVMELAGRGNRHFNDAAPWFSVAANRAAAEIDLAVAGHLIRCLRILVSPFLPAGAERLGRSLGPGAAEGEWRYSSFRRLIVGNLEPLYKKVE